MKRTTWGIIFMALVVGAVGVLFTRALRWILAWAGLEPGPSNVVELIVYGCMVVALAVSMSKGEQER